jgi:hypothetical protein
VDIGTRRAGFQRLEGRGLCPLGQVVPLADLVVRIAPEERPGHVRVVLRRLVLGEDVDDDRLARRQRAATTIVGIGGVGTTGDDRLV